jgi:RND superfamily putative drug exporter
MLHRLADWCYTRRRTVLVVWVLALVAIGAAAGTIGSAYSNNFKMPGTESQQAFDLLQSRFPSRSGDSGTIVFKAAGGIDQPAVRARMEALFAKVAVVPHVVGVASPYGPDGARQVSRDRSIAFATVQFDERAYDVGKSTASGLARLAHDAGGGGVQVETAGSVFGQLQSPQGKEGVGLLGAMLVLLITFGSLLAMGLPLMTALFGIGIGASLLGLLTHVLDTPVFAPQVASMISIGVGIDYALFIVTRYRSALAGSGDPRAAVVESLTTAGRAVLFAGTTVVISLMGMLLMGFAFVRGLAVGASVAVLVTMLAAITLLPAVLGFVGHNIDKLRVPFLRRAPAPASAAEAGHRHTFAWRYSRAIQRRPWPLAIGGLLVLLALAAPVLSLRLGVSDDGNLPRSASARRGYDLLSQGFGPGFNGPFVVVADHASAAGLGVLQGRLLNTPGVAFASPPVSNPAGDTAIITVFPSTAPQDAATTKLLHRLRSSVVPSTGVRAYTGGLVAAFEDQTTTMSSRLPVFFGAVILLSFLLLMAVFRSVLVPLKAAVMNLLSIGAAYGILVAVFQWGWLSGLVGVDRKGPIESWLPMMLFAILFGLSMDYEVFLLSRIREEWLRSSDNGLAVADGLATTARVITAAAAIMVLVFLAFALDDLRVLKEVGIGMASAVFIDATVVRMVLVPATMELLGERNWWLPRWLDRVVPNVEVDRPDRPDPAGPEPAAA